jgi:hypothetical protein
MTALAERLGVSAQAISDFEALLSIALFSAAGLLMSVSILVLDAYLPGEWF